MSSSNENLTHILRIAIMVVIFGIVLALFASEIFGIFKGFAEAFGGVVGKNN